MEKEYESPLSQSILKLGKSMPCICIPKRLTLHLSFFNTALECWCCDFHILCQMFLFRHMYICPYFQVCLESVDDDTVLLMQLNFLLLHLFLFFIFNDIIRGQDKYWGPFFLFFFFFLQIFFPTRKSNKLSQFIVAEFDRGYIHIRGSYIFLKPFFSVLCVLFSNTRNKYALTLLQLAKVEKIKCLFLAAKQALHPVILPPRQLALI